MIPIYVFDEHNEAFYFWHEAKKDGFLNEPTDLFHVDAHHDMGRPEPFQKSLYFPDDSPPNGYLNYFQDFARSELNIGNYIFPAVLCGLIRNVYFIFPPWRNCKTRRKKMNVCSVFGEGKILKYNLRIDKKPDPRIFRAYPDLTHFNFSMQEIEKIPQNRKMILDIDLDYFACSDTVTNRIRYELEITKDQFLQKEVFLQGNTLPFSGLEFGFAEKDERFYVAVGLKKVRDRSHLPDHEEIESEIGRVVDTFRSKKIRPVVITLCRSSVSGYCPKEYAQFIEQKLIERLRPLVNPG